MFDQAFHSLDIPPKANIKPFDNLYVLCAAIQVQFWGECGLFAALKNTALQHKKGTVFTLQIEHNTNLTILEIYGRLDWNVIILWEFIRLLSVILWNTKYYVWIWSR